MNKSFFKNQIFRVIVSFVLIAVAHFLLLEFKLPEIYSQAQPWKIYLFIVPITFLGMLYIVKRFQKDNKSMVNTFMFYTVVKMLGSIIFLFPWFFHKDLTSKPMIIQFFAVFFPILIMETIFLVRLLSNSDEQLEKK